MKPYLLGVLALFAVTACVGVENESPNPTGNIDIGPNSTASESETADTGTGDEALDTETGDEEPDTGTGDDETDGLEIIGTYTTEWDETIEITETEWTNTSEWGEYVYRITTFDNDLNYLVTDNDADDLWSRFEWADADGDLYYCQILYDAATEADASGDENLADDSDLETGCNGFAWTRLSPAD